MTTKKDDKSAVEMVADKKADPTVKSDAAEQVAKDALVSEIEQDTGTAGVPTGSRWLGSDEIMLWTHFLDLGADEFEAAVADDADHPIPDNKVYGLLALERNGKNRTPYVQAMMKRLDLKPEELPGGGPGYTNDVTNITSL